MRTSLAVLAAVLASGACNSATVPTTDTPTLASIDGATNPLVRPGAQATFTGRYFGAKQGGGRVLVTGANGPISAHVTRWSNGAIAVTLPATLATGPAVVVAASGDTLGPLSLTVRDSEAFAPADLGWKSGPSLPAGLRDAGATTLLFPTGKANPAVTTLVAVVGGADSAGALSRQLLLGVGKSSTGAVASWVAADSLLPAARRDPAVAAADQTNSATTLEGVLYVLGGLDAHGLIASDVYGVALYHNAAETSNGQGFWAALTPLPDPTAGAAAIVAFGNLIVVGGIGSDSVASRSVNVAEINPSGTLNAWFAGPALPEGLAFTSLVLHGTTLYVIGGETGAIDPSAPDTASLQSGVYSISLSPHTGFFADTAWRSDPPLLRARAHHVAFALDTGILVTGGAYVGAPDAAESEFAPFDSTARLGPFAAVTAPTLASLGESAVQRAVGVLVRDGHGRGHPTIVGGTADSTAAASAVWWH